MNFATRNLLLSIGLTAAVSAFASGVVSAQPEDETRPLTRHATVGGTTDLRAILQRLESGTEIRVSNPSAFLDVEGELLAVYETRIVVGVGPLDDHEVDLDEIQRLSFITGRRTRQGAELGMILGALAGVVLATTVANLPVEGGSGVIVAYGVVGLWGGGMLGAMVGSQTSTWEPAFVRR